MNSYVRGNRIHLIVALITLIVGPAFGKSQAENGTPQQRSASEQPASSREGDSDSKTSPKPDPKSDSSLQSEVQRLKTRMEEMQSLIDQQQRALADLAHEISLFIKLVDVARINRVVGKIPYLFFPVALLIIGIGPPVS